MLPVSLFWKTANQSIDAEITASIGTLDSCFLLSGEVIVEDPKSSVTIHQSGDTVLYIKKYKKSGKFLRKYLGRSRLRAEWENLLFFKSLDIPVPPMLAWGEQRKGLCYVKGALVTLKVEYASNLQDFFRNHPNFFGSQEKYRSLASQIALYTQQLHAHQFAHGDLNWRNILVSYDSKNTETPNVYFFDCPSGRHWPWPFLEYRIVKDLAHLDKVARDKLSLRDRILFYKEYTGRAKLTVADKRRLRKVVRYFDV